MIVTSKFKFAFENSTRRIFNIDVVEFIHNIQCSFIRLGINPRMLQYQDKNVAEDRYSCIKRQSTMAKNVLMCTQCVPICFVFFVLFICTVFVQCVIQTLMILH